MARKKEFKDVRQLLAENLEKAYERWDLLYKNGGSDPFWCDGTNLNLVRNHILYYREQCEEVLEPKDYPEAYHKELPPVVPDDYMAKKGEIMQDAQNLYLTLTLNWRIRIIQVEMAIPNTIALNGRLPFMIYRI